jgi:protein-S-isoprenylcysteine O-methyltransferase Ste14
MPLVEELENRGQWLFRWRSFIPLVVIPPALYVTYALEPAIDPWNLLWLLACVAVSVLGQTIRAFTIGYVPKGTSGRNTSEGQVAMTLNTKGMYGMVRHPLYLGNYLMWLGILMYSGSIILTIAVSIFYWTYYTMIAMAEERYLREKFGESYVEWANGRPAFFPRKLKWQSPGVFFSMKNVLKREYNGAYVLFVSFAALDFLYHLREGSQMLSPNMQAALTTGSVIFLVLRFMKKRTKLLDVEGREYTK